MADPTFELKRTGSGVRILLLDPPDETVFFLRSRDFPAYSFGRNTWTDRDQWPYYIYITRRGDGSPLSADDFATVASLASQVCAHSGAASSQPFAQAPGIGVTLGVAGQVALPREMPQAGDLARRLAGTSTELDVSPVAESAGLDLPTGDMHDRLAAHESVNVEVMPWERASMLLERVWGCLDEIAQRQIESARTAEDGAARSDRILQRVQDIVQQKVDELRDDKIAEAKLKLAEESLEYSKYGELVAAELDTERTKCIRVQADLAEARRRLSVADDLNRDLRTRVEELEFDRSNMEGLQTECSSGVRWTPALRSLLLLLSRVNVGGVFLNHLTSRTPIPIPIERLTESIQSLLSGAGDCKPVAPRKGYASFSECRCNLSRGKGTGRLYFDGDPKHGLVVLGFGDDKTRARQQADIDSIYRLRKCP